jgi:Icc-related predicted phosphoesterase
MKILAVSDRPPKVSIKKTVLEYQIDLICTLGDLEYLQIKELADTTTIPKIGVYGNHCSGNYFNDLGIKNMHMQTFEYKGITFGGFEGSVKYKDDPYSKMYTQEEADTLLKDFPYVDVLLCHSPPFGINDETDPAHIGLKAIRKYLEEKKPKYLLHGHTYPKEDKVITKYLDSQIIYVYGDKVISVNIKA